MANYNYTAINEKGKQFKGVMGANNESDLEYKLSEIGLELISFSDADKKGFGLSFSHKITSKDLILLCTHFEQLDKAGVPIAESIQDLRDSGESPQLRDLLQDIFEDVKSGKMLSEAFAEHPKIFDDIFVGLINAGEKTGSLHQSFHYLTEHLKWSMEIKRKTKKATRYPMFLFAIMFIVTGIMMVFVIPKLSDFLLKQNFDLPFYTAALIGFSDFFKAYWHLMLIIPILIYLMNKVFYRLNEKYAFFVDNLVLRLPFFGKTILKIETARFSQFFLMTFQSGLDVMQCFEIVEKVVANKVLQKKIAKISQEVSDGSSISNALRSSSAFPNMVVRMFEIGESTGNMADALKNVKYFYDKEVNDSVEGIIGVIQPALTLVMGGLLLWISLSVFGPLYQSFSTIK